MTRALPRLRSIQARQIATRLSQISNPADVEVRLADLATDGVWFEDSAGPRFSVGELRSLREGVEGIARDCGFPGKGDVSSRGRLDNLLVQYLGENLKQVITPSEGLQDDAWVWFTLKLAPDITVWRFPNPDRKRLLGGNRNMFRRLWDRCCVFDRGEGHENRWSLVSALTEDAMVAICERTSVLRDASLCLAIGEAWLDASGKLKGSALETRTRRALKAVTARNEVISLSSLSPDQLNTFLSDQFSKT
ncbi:MAG: hypothetical protein ACRBEQ_07220 [Hyphomonas sp.]